MSVELYSARWRRLKSGSPDPEAVAHLARQIALSFMDSCLYCNLYEFSFIDLLCEMATEFDPRSGLNEIASAALFGIVVEGLCDEFEEMQTEVYERVMCRIVSFCRGVEGGMEMDARLKQFGFFSRESLIGRAAGLRIHSLIKDEIPPPEKIVFLSRITIGADIAITSVLMQRFAEAYPKAELVLLGSAKLKGVFGKYGRLKIRELNYPRRGDLLERFSTWFDVLEAIEAETGLLADRRFLVIDPDSRLSQLGILPVTAAGKYLFFNSRRNGISTNLLSMSELANEWANRILPEAGFCSPCVWIDEESTRAAKDLISRLRQSADHIVTVNLGVGGNERKRIDEEFECKLLKMLMSDSKTSVILDCGADTEEIQRANRLLQTLAKEGFATGRTDMKQAVNLRSPGIISVVCGIGEIAAVISESDEFIGYDSACQHIASAQGVPSCTVFAGSNNPRFVRRWQAKGKSDSKIIHVDNLSKDGMFEHEDIIARINYARVKR